MKPNNFRKPKPQVEISSNAGELVKEALQEVEDEIKQADLPNAEVAHVEYFLNIRKEPSTKKGTIITMLPKGTKIVVKDKKPVKNVFGEWYKVKVLDPELEGYAMTKYIIVK